MRPLRVPKCASIYNDFADLSLTPIPTTRSPRLLKQVQRGPTDWVCVGPRINSYEDATSGKVVDLIASTLANPKLSFWGLHLHILIMWRSRVLGASV